MHSFVHSLFEHHLTLLLESILLSHHVKVRSTNVPRPRPRPILGATRFRPGTGNPFLSKQEAARIWTIVPPHPTHQIAPKFTSALTSPSTAPPLRSSNGRPGVSTRRSVHVLKPRDRPSQRPPSILLFLFLSRWDLFTAQPLLGPIFIPSLCKLVPWSSHHAPSQS